MEVIDRDIGVLIIFHISRRFMISLDTTLNLIFLIMITTIAVVIISSSVMLLRLNGLSHM